MERTNGGVAVAPARREVHRDDAPAGDVPAAVAGIAVAVATVAALWIRVHGLTGWDGTLSVDEARLAMAGRGILETGLPILPSGWTYTRGLLAAYLVAPSLALLGPSDFAARLPSALAGTALVPVAYLLGARAAGRLGGLFAALLLMGHPSLVVWSRQAWFYALYVLLYAAALLFILRAHQTGRARDQLLAGAFVGLSLFAHETGIFLLAPLGVQVAARRPQARGGRGRWAPPLAALAIVAAAATLLWALVTTLRATSLVGAYGELDEYFQPRLQGSNVGFYVRMLLDGPGLLLGAALLGVPLALWRRRLEVALLWLALLLPFAHAAFVIPRGPQERYGLTLIVVLAVLAAEAVVGWAGVLAGRARRWPALSRGPDRAHRPGGGPPLEGKPPAGGRRVWAAWAAGATLLLMLLAHQDIARAVDRAALNPREGSWLRELRALGVGPADAVMTDVPTIVGWYLGGLDYWISSRDYEKYATRDGDLLRDVHTGAALIRNRRDYERLVGGGHAGGATWLVASGRSYQWGELVDDDFRRWLESQAVEKKNPGDGTRIWRMQGRPTP